MRLNWSNVGRGLGDIGDAVREKKLAEESAILSKKMDDSTTYSAKQEGGGALSMPDQQTAENFAAYNNTIAAEDEATFGGGALSSAPKTTVDKAQTYTRADYYADMGKRASSLGMLDKSERFNALSETTRDRERARQREDERFAMDKERFNVGMENDRLDLGEKKAAAASRQRVDQAWADFSQRREAGEFKTIGDIRKWAADAKLTPDEEWKVIGAANNTDTAVMENVQKAHSFAMKQSARAAGGSLQKFLDLTYNDEKNPLFADGRTANIVKGKNGMQVVDSDGAVVWSGADEAEGIAAISTILDDPLNAYAFQQKLAEHKMKMRKGEAEIDESKAKTGSALASAAKTRVEADNLKAGRGDGKYKVEANEVSSALGKPALDERGRPITDDYGMQKFIRDPAEEDRFYKWMRANNLRDTNQALAMWKGGAGDANKPAAPAPNPNRKPLSHFAN